jgi:hypothetical protein
MVFAGMYYFYIKRTEHILLFLQPSHTCVISHKLPEGSRSPVSGESLHPCSCPVVNREGLPNECPQRNFDFIIDLTTPSEERLYLRRQSLQSAKMPREISDIKNVSLSTNLRLDGSNPPLRNAATNDQHSSSRSADERMPHVRFHYLRISTSTLDV